MPAHRLLLSRAFASAMLAIGLVGCGHAGGLGIEPAAPALAIAGAAAPAATAMPVSAPAASEAALPAGSASNEVIVRFRGEPRPLPGATLVGPLGLPHAYLYRLTRGSYGVKAVDAWADAEDIVFAEPNFVYHATAEPNDPMLADAWGIGAVGAPAAWATSAGDGVTVAVVDTGVFAQHPDLAGQVLPGVDLVGSGDGRSDDHGHGTHVAGTIAAIANNALGVAGVAPRAKILPIRVLDAHGLGTNATIASGIMAAARRGARVINLSLGGPDDSATLHAAIDAVRRMGIVVVAAGGNDNSAAPFYPAAYDGVLGVAAVDKHRARASFSNFGSSLSLAAPGVAIASTSHDGAYASLSGTSMAAPHVAGIAALLLAKAPGLKPAQVARLLQQSGQPTQGFSGSGPPVEVDAVAAFQGLAGLDLAPLPPVAGLTATPGAPGEVLLAWTAGSGRPAASGYHVVRDGETLATVSAPEYRDVGLAPGQEAHYQVTAFDDSGNESDPGPGAVVRSGAPSDRITGLHVTRRGAHDLTITWQTRTPMTAHLAWGPGDALSERSDAENAPATQHSVALQGLSRFKRYGYRVVATDAGGQAVYSETRHARTKLWFLFGG